MRVLELFSGTGSVGKVCRAKGWGVESLDIDPRADINIDILEWDYKAYNVGDYDIIWASPPCTLYSSFQFYHDPLHQRDLSPANKLVLKTMDIISYFEPKYWFIENPQTGCLKDQEFMIDLPFHDVDYCMYDYGARKRTRIWTNYEEFEGKMCDKTCAYYGDNASPKHKRGHPELPSTRDGRHKIPAPLIRDLLGCL